MILNIQKFLPNLNHRTYVYIPVIFALFLNYLLFYFSNQAQLNSLLPGIDETKWNHFPAANGTVHDPKLLTSSLRHG